MSSALLRTALAGSGPGGCMRLRGDGTSTATSAKRVGGTATWFNHGYAGWRTVILLQEEWVQMSSANPSPAPSTRCPVRGGIMRWEAVRDTGNSWWLMLDAYYAFYRPTNQPTNHKVAYSPENHGQRPVNKWGGTSKSWPTLANFVSLLNWVAYPATILDF